MVLQEKLVNFDNPTIVLQPANVVALFFQRAKDAAEAVEDDYASAEKGPAFESEDATADEDTAFGSEDAAAAADEDAAFESADTAADEDAAFGSAGKANTATKQTFRSMGLQC